MDPYKGLPVLLRGLNGSMASKERQTTTSIKTKPGTKIDPLLRHHFGVGALPILVLLSGDWDVHSVRYFDPWPCWWEGRVSCLIPFSFSSNRLRLWARESAVSGQLRAAESAIQRLQVGTRRHPRPVRASPADFLGVALGIDDQRRPLAEVSFPPWV